VSCRKRSRVREAPRAARPRPAIDQRGCQLAAALGGRFRRVAITWIGTPLDAEFSPIRQHRADAGLGWLTVSPDTLDAMSLGQFQPEVWIAPRTRPPTTGLSA